MSEQQGADEALTSEDAPEASDATPTATAVIERPVEEEQGSADEATPDAQAGEDPAPDELVADEPAADEPVAVPTGAVRTARVFVCECGYRTVAIWGDPQACQAKRSRRGEICGKPLYALDHVPDKVQKALNPLKASKKKAKGSD